MLVYKRKTYYFTVANIWTHSGSQEFRRPCDLENDSKIKDEGMCQLLAYNC